MKKIGLSAAMTVALLLPRLVLAEGGFSDITWIPQIGVQMKNLEFEQQLRADTPIESGEGSLDVNMPTLSLSLTAIYQKLYLSLKYEDSFNDASDFSDVPNTDAETKVERTDYSITVGYNIFGNMSVFAGYMNGETTLRPQPRCPAYARPDTGFPPNPDCGDGGFGFPSLDGNKAQDNNVLGLTDYEQTYEEDGWLLGVSYGWRFGETGNLTLSAAYAELDASYKDNWLSNSPEFAGQPYSYDFSGDANGLSIGVNWSGALTDHVGYYIDLRQQSYDMSATQDFAGRPDRPEDDANPNPPPVIATRRVSTEETITAATAGIQWYF